MPNLEEQRVNKRGLNLLAQSCDNLWPSLLALRPAGVVALDAHHLPDALPPAAEQYWLWRPWVWRAGEAPRPMRQVTPREYIERARQQWQERGRPPFHGLQLLNEPNLEYESGYPDGSQEAMLAAIEWQREAVTLARALWPEDRPGWDRVDIHSPPLSPFVNASQCYEWLRPLVEECAVLNVHCYLADRWAFRHFWTQFPLLPQMISETGAPGHGTAEYGQQLLAYWDELQNYSYVRWAAPFCWQQAPEFADWSLEGTPAAAVLMREPL